MSRFFTSSLFLLLILTDSQAAAPIVSYNMLPDRIRKNNPDLIAARFRIAEAQARLSQAGRLANPELSVEMTHNNHLNERSLTIGFTQSFPRTDRLRIEQDLSLLDIKSARAEVREQERLIIAKARKTLVHLLAQRAHNSLRSEQIALADKLNQFITDLVSRGEASELDAGQARLSALQLGSEMRQLNAEQQALAGQLKVLLGLSPADSLVINGDLLKMPVPHTSSSIGQRGDIQSAKHSIDAASKRTALEYAKRKGDIEASIFTSIERTEDAPEGFETEGILGIGFSIPLPLWDKNEGNIQAAEIEEKRRKKELQATRKKALNQIQTAHEEMLTWAKLIREIDGTILSEATEQSKLSENSYREGLTDLQHVLKSREQILQIRKSRIDALKGFHLARAAFESAQGL